MITAFYLHTRTIYFISLNIFMVVKSLKVVSFRTIYGSCLDLTLTLEGHFVLWHLLKIF